MNGGLDDGYEAVIGLEIHVQLRTQTKMFCGCELSFGDEANVHTCEVCLAHPGSLPVVNEQAILYGIQIGLALGCEIAPRSIFHRKNYFYPDNPKAYQISQYDIPLASGGHLGDIRIHRVHLEEDAAKLVHVGESGRIHGSGSSLVDFNRGGTPLVEIVTEPDVRSGAEAREWLQLLRATIKAIGASDVNMDEGSLRCDANVSIRPTGTEELGTKTELKNMNSFRFIERGIDAELARQRDLVERGGAVTQETLHFDPRSGSITSLRSKEEAHDYRYFPEPDLVPLAPTDEMLAGARAALPELPAEREARYISELRLPDAHARQLARDPGLGDFFEAVMGVGSATAGAVANWVTGEAAARKAEPAALASLVAMVEAGKVTNQAAKKVLATLAEDGGDPAAIIEREGLGAMEDAGELSGIVDRALEAHPDEAAKVREGAMQAIGPIIGFVMRETKGRADGREVTRLVREKLGL
ncbi:MAG: Asp-tRNA(Asn)/Glu-tRNA(Gln) amidotransferase subunit GatB [Actinomycetota bacterium]|nr:Asp-tRNA(Asn)/Glu-tRNA(Gln) amidotransferase subunit GatB [Actinomycetota bacterium]